MFKKTLYPLTDWNWLKLPLASLVLGGLTSVMALVTAGNFYFHGEHIDAAVSGFLVFYFALGMMFFLLLFAGFGYLLRVMRQSGTDSPFRLPNWSEPVALLKQGFLAYWGVIFGLYFVMIVVAIPSFVVLGILESSGLLSSVHEALGGGGLSMGLGMVCCVAIALFFYAAVFFWLIVIVPILIARYAHTGRFRDLFRFRWAWRAFVISPFQYLARTAAWGLLISILTILTPLNVVGGYAIAVLLAPLSLINTAYLIGDYYHLYLDD